MPEQAGIESNRSRLSHLAVSAGFTALSGLGWGLQVGLLAKNTDIGLYLAQGGVPLLSLTSLIAAEEWNNFNTPAAVAA